jgi:probable HAF family extracellular repeat protein
MVLFTLAGYSQTFHFAAINFPGAISTRANGINNQGKIVGVYTSASGRKHGFTLFNKTFTTFNVPGAIDTGIQGINDLGDFVGFYTTPDLKTHGFIRHHTGSIVHLNFPGAQATTAMGISKQLTVVGFYSTGNDHGFRWSSGVFTKVEPKNTVTPGDDSSHVNGISNLGVIAGDFFSGDSFHSFFKIGSDLDQLDPNNPGDNEANGVNGHGDVVGGRVNGPSQVGFFAANPEAGETAGDKNEHSPTLAALAFPGAAATTAMSINFNRVIVGWYVDPQLHEHGFLAIKQ